MGVDQYFDLDLHFLIFSVIPVGLILLYIAIRLVIFLVKIPFRLCKRKQTAPVEDQKVKKE